MQKWDSFQGLAVTQVMKAGKEAYTYKGDHRSVQVPAWDEKGVISDFFNSLLVPSVITYVF